MKVVGDQTGFEQVEECEPGLCDAEGEQCNICFPDSKSCDGDTVLICDADGQGYDFENGDTRTVQICWPDEWDRWLSKCPFTGSVGALGVALLIVPPR